MSEAPTGQDAADALLELTISGFNAGVLSLATNLLNWLDNRPFTSLETLVIQLRANLEEVRDGIRDDMQQSVQLSQSADD